MTDEIKCQKCGQPAKYTEPEEDNRPLCRKCAYYKAPEMLVEIATGRVGRTIHLATKLDPVSYACGKEVDDKTDEATTSKIGVTCEACETAMEAKP